MKWKSRLDRGQSNGRQGSSDITPPVSNPRHTNEVWNQLCVAVGFFQILISEYYCITLRLYNGLIRLHKSQLCSHILSGRLVGCGLIQYGVSHPIRSSVPISIHCCPFACPLSELILTSTSFHLGDTDIMVCRFYCDC